MTVSTNSGQWIGLLETEDGKCVCCGRPSRSVDWCCPAKARLKVSMLLTAKRVLEPPRVLIRPGG